MTREDFVKYKASHYVARGTVIVVCGSVSKSDVDKEVQKHFGAVHTGVKGKKLKTKDVQAGPKVLVKHKATDQTHFVLGVRSFSLFDKRNSALTLLGGILGAGMSSRLFIKLREEMGVAYYVRAYNDLSLDHGSFQISAGVNNARTEEVLKEILKECTRLTREKVTERELEKVKSFLVGNMKLSLEATDDIANFYGTQELLRNEVKTLDEKIKVIMKVTSSDIHKVAKEVFKTKHLNLALIGPYKESRKFQMILKF
jgi:predicted Zn-dependent peptidase